MNSTLLFLLEIEDRTAFGNALRIFLATLVKAVYKLFSGAIDLMYDLAMFDFDMNDYINNIGEKIFNLLIIFMLFKVSISFMTYLVNPDLATDKNKGVQNIIKRILITIILLISINPLFTILKNLQSAIIEDEIISNVFDISNDVNTITIGDQKIVGVKMNPNCPSDKYIYTTSKGDRMALLLFRPFLQPHSQKDINKADNGSENAWEAVFGTGSDKDSSSYCGVSSFEAKSYTNIVIGANQKETSERIKADIPGPNSAEGFMLRRYYNLSVDEAPTSNDKNGKGADSQYFYDFNGFIALAAGVVGLLIMISFCFDVVIRSLNLIILQMIAPIPIISYISPQGKSSEMLGIWGKKVLSVWASLFIRIIVLSLAIMLIDGASNSIKANLGFNNTSLLMDLFIILGILMFAKKLPKLLEELIPGLKLDGGFQLNPFKRIENDALGGKYISGGIAAAGNSVLQSGIQAGSNALAFGRNKMLLKKQLKDAEKNNDKEKAAKIQRKLNRMSGSTGWLNLGSTITGGALRGAYQGAGSGFKTGTSGSANILKNVKVDTEKGNRSRNNAQNIFNFNSQLKEDYKSGDIEKEDYKAQKYGWIDRNVVERIDRNLGIKTDYGGYGYYDKKIGDLSRDIENLQSQEHSVRTALAQVSQYLPQIDALREQVDNKGKSLAEALRKVQNDFGFDDSIKAAIIQDYQNNKHHLDAITYFDQETKRMKAEKKSYEEMLEARESAKKS